MHVGGGWKLGWSDVINWALRDDIELQDYCKQDYVDLSERRATCADKLTMWFESRPSLPTVIVASHPAGLKGLFFVIRYMGIDAKGTLTKFKKFREQPRDVEMRRQIATALNIPEGRFKWVSIPDPFKQDLYL